MPNEHLKEFLREKKAKAPDIDWLAKRDAWVHAVGKLYDTMVGEYLEGQGDVVQIDRARTKQVQEPYIGSYSIPEMTLTVGHEQVLFSPKGVVVVGAEGRVDVQGYRGEATLVRQSGDHWSLVLSRTPRVQLVPLDDESFLEMLRSIMR